MIWEYKVISRPGEKLLNKLGRDLWEMVGIGPLGEVYLKRLDIVTMEAIKAKLWAEAIEKHWTGIESE